MNKFLSFSNDFQKSMLFKNGVVLFRMGWNELKWNGLVWIGWMFGKGLVLFGKGQALSLQITYRK
jgi:hypothetical protein